MAKQELLESRNIPFVGTASRECRRAFDKVKNMSIFDERETDSILCFNYLA